MNNYILGINGWFTRSHDASACIVKDGKILAMAEEERFTRKKHAYDSLPHNSILWCLKKTGLKLDEIKTVAVGWDYKKLYSNAGIKDSSLNNLTEIFFPKRYFQYTKLPNIELVPHHIAHATSSYYLSGMKESSILIVDGQGEEASATFAVGKGNKIEILWSLPIEYSLGYFYEAVSDFIGLGLDAAGKTMGLAPYGKKLFKFDNFVFDNNGYLLNMPLSLKKHSLDQQERVVASWKKILSNRFGEQKLTSYMFNELLGGISKKIKIPQTSKNIAASAQSTLENILLQCVKTLVNKTNINNLCMAGGVALNCSANTKILNSGIINDLFIPPFTNDAGVSIGAALYVGGVISNNRLEDAYLGPLFRNSEIKSLLDNLKVSYEFLDEDIDEKVADIITEGKIVSRFQGQAEIGPRALGNRSILANPSILNINKMVNNAKNREQWRPLAPSILSEKNEVYLEKSTDSPFMLHAFKVKRKYRKEIAGVVHVDGSTRPQSVNMKTNKRYYNLISKFYKNTGIPLVLNTSFNGAKEPIVCTPHDAISSFYSNSTDYLALEGFLLKK